MEAGKGPMLGRIFESAAGVGLFIFLAWIGLTVKDWMKRRRLM
jgi:hypothetical protein